MSKNNNGKLAEKRVHAALSAINLPTFDFQRFYDATSARGAFMAQVGDFGFYLPNCHGVIEVKSTQEVKPKFARTAFSPNQYARLRKRLNAGGKVWAVLWQYNHDKWYALPFADLADYFDQHAHGTYPLDTHTGYDTAAEAVGFLIAQSLQ